MQFGIRLKKLNRVLRWTGWRFYVGFDDAYMKDTTKPMKLQVGFVWYGWGFVKELDQDLIGD